MGERSTFKVHGPSEAHPQPLLKATFTSSRPARGGRDEVSDNLPYPMISE
jgi:hypothetical protein